MPHSVTKKEIFMITNIQLNGIARCCISCVYYSFTKNECTRGVRNGSAKRDKPHPLCQTGNYRTAGEKDDEWPRPPCYFEE